MRLVFLFLLALITAQALAQRRQAGYVEFLGNGLIYTFNYDRRFMNRDDGLGFRLGVNLLTNDGQEFASFIPLHLNYILGKKHAIELGAGLTLSPQFGLDNDFFVIPSGALQYRYQGEQGLLIRAGFSPNYAPVERGQIIPAQIFWFWPGVSAGYRF